MALTSEILHYPGLHTKHETTSRLLFRLNIFLIVHQWRVRVARYRKPVHRYLSVLLLFSLLISSVSDREVSQTTAKPRRKLGTKSSSAQTPSNRCTASYGTCKIGAFVLQVSLKPSRRLYILLDHFNPVAQQNHNWSVRTGFNNLTRKSRNLSNGWMLHPTCRLRYQ